MVSKLKVPSRSHMQSYDDVLSKIIAFPYIGKTSPNQFVAIDAKLPEEPPTQVAEKAGEIGMRTTNKKVKIRSEVFMVPVLSRAVTP